MEKLDDPRPEITMGFALGSPSRRWDRAFFGFKGNFLDSVYAFEKILSSTNRDSESWILPSEHDSRHRRWTNEDKIYSMACYIDAFESGVLDCQAFVSTVLVGDMMKSIWPYRRVKINQRSLVGMAKTFCNLMPKLKPASSVRYSHIYMDLLEQNSAWA